MKNQSILAFIMISASSVLQAQGVSPQTAEMSASGHFEQSTSESIGPAVFADALIWKADQVGTLGFGTKTSIPGGIKEKFLFVSFPWDKGFRTGVRYNTGFDNWVLLQERGKCDQDNLFMSLI